MSIIRIPTANRTPVPHTQTEKEVLDEICNIVSVIDATLKAVKEDIAMLRKFYEEKEFEKNEQAHINANEQG